MLIPGCEVYFNFINLFLMYVHICLFHPIVGSGMCYPVITNCIFGGTSYESDLQAQSSTPSPKKSKGAIVLIICAAGLQVV